MHALSRALERGVAGTGLGVRLDPPTPQSCMLHVYLRGDAGALEAAHAACAARPGGVRALAGGALPFCMGEAGLN